MRNTLQGGVVRAGQQMGKPSFSQSVDRHTVVIPACLSLHLTIPSIYTLPSHTLTYRLHREVFSFPISQSALSLDMSDPYQQYTHPHPQYMQHPSPSGPPPPESEAAYYAPPDSLYQHPPYDYEAQYPYAQHIPPDQYGSQYDASQTPRYQPPIPPPQNQSDNLLSPASAADYHPQEYYDWGRQSPHYEPVGKQGSNADY